jgi:type II secretory pathway pseudopilin PulG
MHLRGQDRFVTCFRAARDRAGYAMAALLVMMNIMAILMAVAMPIWKTVVKREREEELMWRGNQYVRAINLFRRKYANTYPPNIDILLNERFLRKKYADPMTKDGEFQLIYAAQQASQTPGPPGAVGGSQTPGGVTPTPATPPTPLDQSTQGPAGARGGIMGVVSKSTEASMRLFNGRGKYNEWAFTAQVTAGPGGPAGAGGGPGSRTPGGPGAPAGPGSVRPGPGGTRPGPNLPGFPQPGQPRPRPPE